jgi:predicted HicB family RNase H-like nuclease
MGKTTKIGRPALPKNQKRRQYVTTRVSRTEHRQIEQAANESGEMLATWARKKLLAAARRA